MSVKIFLVIFALMAIAVQAATPRFLSPEEITARNNQLQTSDCSSGSGSCSDSVHNNFDVLADVNPYTLLTYYDVTPGFTFYFAAVEKGSDAPSTTAVCTQNGDFAATYIGNNGEAGISGLDADTEYDIYACAQDSDGNRYPDNTVAELAGTSYTNEENAAPGNVIVTSTNTQSTITFDSKVDGTINIAYGKCFTYPGNRYVRGNFSNWPTLLVDGDEEKSACATYEEVQTETSSIASVGVYFDVVVGTNTFTVDHYDVTQTIEPEVFYLAVTPVSNNENATLTMGLAIEVIEVADTTPPVVEITVGISGVEAAFEFSADDYDTVHYWDFVLAGEACPSTAELMVAGQIDLEEVTEYTACIVSVSSGGETTTEIAIVTDDVTAPDVPTASVSSVARFTATLEATSNEGDVYYVISDAAALSAGDIVNGGILIDGEATLAVEPDNTYYVSVAAIDDSNNLQTDFTVVSFTTDPAVIFNTEVYQITSDTTVDGPDNNGNALDLVAGRGSAILLSTSIPTSNGGGAEDAYITLYGGEEGSEYTISKVTTNWIETGATDTCAAELGGKCVNADWTILDGTETDVVTDTATVVDGVLIFTVSDDVAAFIAGEDNFGWLIEGADTSNFTSSESGSGPELTLVFPEDVSAGPNCLEPICEHDRRTITCDSGVISITSAFYGRSNNFQCPYSGGSWAMRNTNCKQDTLPSISETCNGQTECEVYSSNSVFGDPCRGTYKWLDVAYTCVVSVGDFCSGFTASTEQTSCVSSPSGPVYTCGEGFTGSDCSTALPTFNSPLIAYYNFDDESASDLANGNDGVETNADWAKGVSGQGLNLDGTGSAFAANTEANSVAEEFTVCLWAKVDSIDGHTNVLVGNGAYQGGDGFAIYVSEDSKYDTGARATFNFHRLKGAGHLEQAFKVDGNFHFICASFSEAVQSFYVDGQCDTETRFSKREILKTNTDGIAIGSAQDGSAGITGTIDEVRIYNSALTSDEISELFSQDGGLEKTTEFFPEEEKGKDKGKVDEVILEQSDVPCADGSVEGFIGHDNIGACSGGWDVPGVATAESFERGCDSQAGNDGQISGCTVADVCAVGFHVCVNAAEVADKSGFSNGCSAVTDFSNGFFVTRQSGPGNIIQSAEGTNDVFGCGQGAGTKASILPVFTHNKCSRVDGSFKCQGNGRGYDEALTITHESNDNGGVMCCRDDRVRNCGQKSEKKQIEVKVRGRGHTRERCNRIGAAIERHVNKRTGKKCQMKAVRKRSKSSCQSKHSQKSSSGGRGKRMLLQDEVTEYTYYVFDVDTTSGDGSELSYINEIIVNSESDLNAEVEDLTGTTELYSCADGTVQATCASVELRSEVDLPAGSVGDGYGETEAATVGNTSDIVTAVIATSAVFVLLLAVGFAYRAKTAKDVSHEFDSRIMNSSQAPSEKEIEMAAVPSQEGEQESYWVFNKNQNDNVRVVVEE